MLAKEAIAEGSPLLHVPESLMLTANTALKSKHCGSLVKAAELSEWQVGMLCACSVSTVDSSGGWDES